MPHTTKIETFTADHLAQAVMLSQQARWPHRREDWELLLGISHGWVTLDEANRVVGTAVVTPHGTTGGAISMVIVAESLRGRGIGRRLFSVALDFARGRRLRLTATSDGEPLYRSLGFKPFGRIFQRQGTLVAVPELGRAENAAPGDAQAIATLDAVAFGEDRTALLRALAEAGQCAVVRRNGTVEAFAYLRYFGRGRLIGPVVAASTEDARSLISHLAGGLEGAFMRLDITADSGLDAWLDGIGLPQTDKGLVMWTEAPTVHAAGVARTMALASQALG
jgi:GNAT superfamily N-acetyltransferase